MVKNTFTAACLAALALASIATAPTAATAAVPNNIVVQVAPPPPRFERLPPPRRGQAWVPGHWEYRGARHVWIGGYWVRARPGYQYNAPRWVQRDGGRWEMRPGEWQRGDRDGDGIPNRMDRRPNDPTRR